MNERIRELAAQAYAQERLAECPSWKPNRVYDCLMKDFEQVFEIFAELVVEECCQRMQGFTFEEIAVKTLKSTFEPDIKKHVQH